MHPSIALKRHSETWQESIISDVTSITEVFMFHLQEAKGWGPTGRCEGQGWWVALKEEGHRQPRRTRAGGVL